METYAEGDLDVDTMLARTVVNKIADKVQKLDVAKLAPYLQHRALIDADQFRLLTGSDTQVTQQQKATHLLLILNRIATLPNSTKAIQNLYLALLDSFENDVTLGSHRGLAVDYLRPKVLEEVHEEDPGETDMSVVVSRVKPMPLNETAAMQLGQRLGLDNANIADESDTAQQVCLEWFQMNSRACCLVDLVKALMYTPGLGKLVSRLLPLCCSNTPDVCIIIKSLNVHWKQFARYLGYTDDEVLSIRKQSYNGVDDEIRTFLRVWCMPDCGGRTQEILDEAKERANIPWNFPNIASKLAVHGIHRSDGASTEGGVVPICLVAGYHFYYQEKMDHQWNPQRQSMGHGTQVALPASHPAWPVLHLPDGRMPTGFFLPPQDKGEYSAFPGVESPVPTQDLPSPLLSPMVFSDRRRVREVLQCFCQICVLAMVNSKDIDQDVVMSAAEVFGSVKVSGFLARCYNNSQSQETLRQDFLGGDPSPAMFLVQNQILKMEDFQIAALKYHHDNPDKFYSDLVKTFQQIPGEQSLPDNIEVVLRCFFSGQINVGVHVGVLGAGTNESYMYTEAQSTVGPGVKLSYIPGASGTANGNLISCHSPTSHTTLVDPQDGEDYFQQNEHQSTHPPETSASQGKEDDTMPVSTPYSTKEKNLSPARRPSRIPIALHRQKSVPLCEVKIKPSTRTPHSASPHTLKEKESFFNIPGQRTRKTGGHGTVDSSASLNQRSLKGAAAIASHKANQKFQGEEAERDGMLGSTTAHPSRIPQPCLHQAQPSLSSISLKEPHSSSQTKLGSSVPSVRGNTPSVASISVQQSLSEHTKLLQQILQRLESVESKMNRLPDR